MKALFVLLCLCAMVTVHAQDGRDPTQMPRQAQPSVAVPDSSDLTSREGMAVVVREGIPYLVDGTRLYGVGQKLGTARIERITETEVWLRSGKTLRKLPRFAGIVRKPAAKDKGSNP